MDAVYDMLYFYCTWNWTVQSKCQSSLDLSDVKQSSLRMMQYVSVPSYRSKKIQNLQSACIILGSEYVREYVISYSF